MTGIDTQVKIDFIIIDPIMTDHGPVRECKVNYSRTATEVMTVCVFEWLMTDPSPYNLKKRLLRFTSNKNMA